MRRALAPILIGFTALLAVAASCHDATTDLPPGDLRFPTPVADLTAACGTACTMTSDCPSSANECQAVTCDPIGHCCLVVLLDATHPANAQTAGDCQKIVCNGAGGKKSIDDPTDTPAASSTVCLTKPTCTGSPLAPSYTPAPTGTSCAADNKFPSSVCGDTTDAHAAGTCVECNVEADCFSFSDGGAVACVNHHCG